MYRTESGRPLVISHPFRNGFPGFGIGSTQAPGKEEWGLSLHIGHARESFEQPASSLYERAGKNFELVSGEVIPIYDQLYEVQVRKKAERINLTRITDKVPQELRPAPRSQTICLVERNPELFWERVPQYDKLMELDLLKLSIDKKTLKATVELTPTYQGSPGPGEFYQTARKPVTLEVGKGDLLTAHGRSYKVLNVVAPQEIKLDGIDIVGGNGVGNLVGWIEISADPVMPDAEGADDKE